MYDFMNEFFTLSTAEQNDLHDSGRIEAFLDACFDEHPCKKEIVKAELEKAKVKDDREPQTIIVEDYSGKLWRLPMMDDNDLPF